MARLTLQILRTLTGFQGSLLPWGNHNFQVVQQLATRHQTIGLTRPEMRPVPMGTGGPWLTTSTVSRQTTNSATALTPQSAARADGRTPK